MSGNQYTEDEYEWTNAYDKEAWGKCLNRFQVGAGAGVRIALDNKWTLSAQYIFDLNPVAHLKEDMSDVKAYTATLRIAAGYKF